jgi:exopolysaccharide biosynthesis polyprenyl glycosylphosphotransferase
LPAITSLTAHAAAAWTNEGTAAVRSQPERADAAAAGAPGAAIPLPGRARLAPGARGRRLARALERHWLQICVAAELLALALASAGAALADPRRQPGPVVELVIACAFPALALVLAHARRATRQPPGPSLLDALARALGAVSLAAMVLLAFEATAGVARPVPLALREWLFALVCLGGASVLLVAVRRRALGALRFATPTLIVGAGRVGAQLVRRLRGDLRYGLDPVGFIDSDPLPAHELQGPAPAVPVLGGLCQLREAIEATGARRVILAFSREPDHQLVDVVSECQRLGVSVSLVPRLFEQLSERALLEHVGGLPLLSLRPTDPFDWRFAVKHALDKVIAAAALVALAPVFAAAALAVRLSSPGPIFFRQRRVGRDGQEFELLKFRTMRVAAEEESCFELPAGLAPGGIEGVDRRTRVGRFLRDSSIDELPQLINVLRGEMSLVGPRPERPEYVQRFCAEIHRYGDRHRVKSGITGWAQVNGLRGRTSIADRAEWDNYYVRNWSLRLDLRIIALTVAEVLRFRG